MRQATPQPHTRNPRRVSHTHGLASSAFARHYSRNHNCFLFLWVLRCFTSPRSLPHPIYSGTGNTTSLVLGYPIRTPSDLSSVDSSPRLIAASHVLHRLLVPRHPPYALTHLQQQKTLLDKTHRVLSHKSVYQRCSTSTVQFSNNTHQPPSHITHQTPPAHPPTPHQKTSERK